MYLVIRRINVHPHLVEESVRRIEQGLVPLVSRQAGFVEFYLAQVGANEGLTISIFETQQEAEAGNTASLAWAKEQIFPLAQGPAEMIGVGEVLIHRGRGER
jgi:heme-degrading monooxygenase HmoA